MTADGGGTAESPSTAPPQEHHRVHRPGRVVLVARAGQRPRWDVATATRLLTCVAENR